MKKSWKAAIVGAVILAVTLYFGANWTSDQMVIQYFPLDKTHSFKSYKTELHFAEQEDENEYEVVWDIASVSDKPMYLRQDVSLLYVNGRLKGVMNKWIQDTAKIKKQSTLHGEDSKKYQAVTFHQGEIHQDDLPITSIQATSSDTLYVIDSPLTTRTSFRKPQTEEEKKWKQRLDHSISQQINAQWDELIAYYQVPEKKYEKAALTDLAKYNTQPLPGTSKENSRRIMGQLWEGLYKNYILGIADTKSTHPIQSYIPLILFDKNGKHLMVLFEDDTGKKHQLIQYY
ncbi:hypothetical protein MUN89_11020 [Halobacillus salinarum]|uniref:Uncharacterized protein n=1 Tax=Halobacillus salinarum TaxID=2932257 RepID=A0ABY4EDK3_9BACI|nr:hypothetical protein [Halobacillus salinarum]UOQ42520.1 hypothetical protein MUN89_11020 [Halobacillus salinarum]